MAKSDVKKYFKEIEEQYNQEKEILEDVKYYYEKGEMSEESVKDALSNFESAQLIYDTARIFMYKLDLKKPKNDNNRTVEIPENFDDYKDKENR